jgi:hypothetical protein
MAGARDRAASLSVQTASPRSRDPDARAALDAAPPLSIDGDAPA